jgi:tetratricopeptide (TPR) repeat protein
MVYIKKLQELNRDELKNLAKKLNITGYSNLKRDELLKAIQECPDSEIKKALGLGFWHKYWKSFSILAGLASIIALIFTIWSYYYPPNDSDSLLSRLDNIEHSIASKFDDPDAVERITKEYEKKLSRMEETIETIKGVNVDKRNKALEALKKGDYSRSAKMFDELEAKTKKRQVEFNKEIYKELAFYAFNKGEIAFLELDFKGALVHYLESETLDPANSLYKCEVGKSYYTLGKYHKSKDYFEKAFQIDFTHEKGNLDLARDWNNLGLIYDSLGEYKKAIEFYNKALEIYIKKNGEQHPEVANLLINLGDSWRSLGEYQKAIEYGDRALKIFINNYGEQHPKVATLWNNLGLVWTDLNKYYTAIDYFNKALQSDLKNYGKEHPKVAIRWNNLGIAYSSLASMSTVTN